MSSRRHDNGDRGRMGLWTRLLALFAGLVAFLALSCQLDPDVPFKVRFHFMVGGNTDQINEFGVELLNNPVTKGKEGERRCTEIILAEGIEKQDFSSCNTCIRWMEDNDDDDRGNPKPNYFYVAQVAKLTDLERPPESILGLSYPNYPLKYSDDCGGAALPRTNVTRVYDAFERRVPTWEILEFQGMHEMGHLFSAADHEGGVLIGHCELMHCYMWYQFEEHVTQTEFCWDKDLETDNDCRANLGRTLP